MSDHNNKISVLIAVMVTAVSVSVGFFFWGMKLLEETRFDASMLESEIEKGIENYIEKMEKKQMEEQQIMEENQKKKAEEMAKNILPPQENERIRGEKNANVTLIEYSDFECPYCAKFHETAKEFIETSGGKVNWVYRHFPLSFHEPSATEKAMALECVGELKGDKAYWEMADVFYQNQGESGKEYYAGIAKDFGVNTEKFLQCYDSGKYKKLVETQMQQAIDSGVSGTPGNFLYNNETGAVESITGAQPLASLQSSLAKVLLK